jgi:HD-GYP domain-containing protein (c-di-GMP phosphodiesterase class II)
LDATAGQIIINHHQHFDGSGFPNRRAKPGQTEPTMALSGENIHIFCRIATMVDRFDGFRYLPDGSVAPTVVALKRLRNAGYAGWFDPYVYEAFLSATPAFCIGEQVMLNTGQHAAVVEFNEGAPCRPVVRPIDLKEATNPEANAKELPDIDLSKRTDLFIAKQGDFDVSSFLH